MLTLAALCLAAAATNEIGSSAHSVTGVTHACHASPLAILTGITFLVFVPQLQIYVVYTIATFHSQQNIMFDCRYPCSCVSLCIFDWRGQYTRFICD
jgi:hypothetical protein